MRSLIFTTALCLSFAAFIAADNSNNNDGCTQTLNHRPNPTSHPYHPGKPHLPSPPRTKTCYVPARGGGLDDSQAIYSAFKACNNGGTVAFLETKYTIAQPLDLTFLNAVDVSIQGEISINPNVQYWVLHAFQYAYQGSSLFWQFGGNDVNIYGGGTINGNGQAWWDILPTNSTIIRPHLIGIIGLHGGSVSNLNLINPPNWFHFVANSSDLIFDRMRMTAISNNTNPPKNSDGWDLYRSDSVVVQNSVVLNDDDCVSFKPNATNIVVQNMHCTNSHGISVGSLGQYVGEVDIVENIYIYNATMVTSGDAARIKMYGGIPPTSTSLTSGGGTGFIRNVTYHTIIDQADNYAIELTQCYGQTNITACNLHPSGVVIEDVLFENFSGTSGAYAPVVGTLVCSSSSLCSNIVAKNINITNTSGKEAEWVCTNVDDSVLAINCIL